MSESPLAEHDSWRTEADAVIKDVGQHVRNISVSECLPSTSSHIYLEVETLEGSRYCVQLAGAGFRIFSESNDQPWYETPYSLLGAISPMFQRSFGEALLKKLEEIDDKE